MGEIHEARLAERLSHASGALSDILVTITDCLPSHASDVAQAQARSILHRILCSSDTVRRRPSWFRFDWERELWEQYENGTIKAAGRPNEPAYAVALALAPPTEEE